MLVPLNCADIALNRVWFYNLKKSIFKHFTDTTSDHAFIHVLHINYLTYVSTDDLCTLSTGKASNNSVGIQLMRPSVCAYRKLFNLSCIHEAQRMVHQQKYITVALYYRFTCMLDIQFNSHLRPFSSWQRISKHWSLWRKKGLSVFRRYNHTAP